jgi:hypothetical protein
VIRLEAFTPAMTAKMLAHLAEVEEITPGLRLVDPSTGELRPGAVHLLLVPSHASRPGHRWLLKCSWHPGSVRAWHHGETCPAFELLGRCWHQLAAVIWTAEAYHGGQVPQPVSAAGRGRPRRPGTSPPGRRRPEPARPRPEAYAVGFYD